MHETRYELTVAQAAFLEAARKPSSRKTPYSDCPSRWRFPGALPTVSDQFVRGTCVASAVAELVASYEGCRRRVSVQYLDEVTRLVEHAWVERNVRRLIAGEAVEKDFEAAFPDAVSQAALLVRANGAGSEAATAFVRSLGTKIRARVESDSGCRLKRCFEALEEYGACREELWPYSPVALNAGAIGGDAVGAFPPGTHEDARRHRVVDGLYVLRSPNNVEEIKGILVGAQGRRPMPVCAGMDLFEGCTDGAFALPDVVREEDGRVWTKQRPLGVHEVLLVGYEDDPKEPGGGRFTFLNSWGRGWGKDGAGRVSYAYVACFCREAGTILQENDDCAPAVRVPNEAYVIARRRATMLCAVGICLLAMATSVGLSVWVAHKVSARSPLPSIALPAPSIVHGVSDMTTNAPAVRVTTNAPLVRVTTNAPAAPSSRSVAEVADGDDSFAVEKIVDYRFHVRGTCDSNAEAIGVAYALDGEHRVFSFENMHLTDDAHGFEGEMTIEGLRGRPPDVEGTLMEYFKRKKKECGVRNWSVRRLW